MKRNVLLVAACVAIATQVWSQNNPAPAAPGAAVAQPPAGAPANAPIEGVRTNAATDLVPLIVIDDVPLIDAVKNLARQAGLNYLPDPKLATVTNQPNVTMRLENVSAQDALMAVLETYNLQVIHDPRIKVARITVKDPKAADPLVTKIVQLKNIQPTNVVDVLKRAAQDPRTQIQADVRTSQLIVVATEKDLPALEDVIAKLDTPTRQVLIEAQLWETAKNPRSVKGIDWAGTFAAQSLTWGNAKLDQGNSSVTTVRPGDAITATTPDGSSTTVNRKSSTKEIYNYIPGSGLTFDSVKGFHPGTAFLNADGLNAVVSFFNTEADTEVVATPRAVTLDHQAANLSVTRAFPIFKITPGSANSPAGAETTYTNLGTILTVTPHITANSNIALHVIPEVSDIAGKDVQTVNGFQNSANIYAIRRMETHVMVPSGNTLVLGGLISDRTSDQQNKVPLLGDIPYIGKWAFHKSDKSRDKANLIVFITPTIISDYDFQVASTDFLQTKMPNRPEAKESFIDSARPYDWTKPKADATTSPAK